MYKIDSFTGKYHFLSNFYNAPVKFDGLLYKNNETAFQSAKVLNREQRKAFCNLDPSTAKKKGRSVPLREDWEEIKDVVMKIIVFDKFYRNLDLRAKLLRTGNAELIEGNWWGDTYWGVCNGEGLNMLGKILMEVRDELRLMTNK